MIKLATIVWHPVLSSWGVALATVVGVFLVLATYALAKPRGQNAWLLPALRLLVLGLLVFLLLQPERRRERVREELPVMAVVLDVSASMTEKLGPNKKSRAQLAAEFLNSDEVRQLDKRFRVRHFTVGARAESVPATWDDVRFNSPESRLLTGLQTVFDRMQDESMAGVIVVSDGLDRSGGDPDSVPLRFPLYIPSLEKPFEVDERVEQEWTIADVSYPKRTIAGWTAPVEVMVRRSGGLGAKTLPVRLYADTELVETREIRFEKGARLEHLRFDISPETVGAAYYTIEIEPDEDGRPDNNVFQFMVEVIDSEMRVLYLEGTPRWEFKFFKNALFRESQFSLDAFVQAANGVFLAFDETRGMSADGGGTPDLSAESLSKYKVLVLGELEADAINANAEAIEAFVETGGGLLILGGRRSFSANGVAQQPTLQKLLPVRPAPDGMMVDARFQLNFTPEGHQHPALSGLTGAVAIPPVLSLWKPVRLHALGTALLTAPDASPLIAVRRYGRGRTAVILTDSLWRWRMAGRTVSGRDDAKDPLYDRFYSQLVHWLAPSGKDLQGDAGFEMVVSGHEFKLREPVRIGAVTGLAQGALDSLQCQVDGPGGSQVFSMTPVLLGAEFGVGTPVDGYAFTFRAEIPGRYTASSGLPDGSDRDQLEFLVERPRDEMTGAPINRSLLETLAERSGGRFASLSEWDGLLKGVHGLTREIAVTEEKPIWDYAIILLLVIGLLVSEWFLRRKANLM
jgi:uncharacterized membrane protein